MSNFYNTPRTSSLIKRGAVDMHEVLRNEIYSQRESPAPTPRNNTNNNVVEEKQIAGFNDTEIYFDSYYRDSSSILNYGILKWYIAPLNGLQDITNCIEMTLGEFYIPKLYPAPGKPELLYFKRIMLEVITSPYTQAVLGPETTRFHFEFTVQNINSQGILLVPIKKSYFFRAPLNSISDFSVRFLYPAITQVPGPVINSQPVVKPILTPINLPPDTISITNILVAGFGTNPIIFRINGGYNTSVLGPIGSTGLPGLAAFIAGYTPNDFAFGVSVTDPAGHYIDTIIDSNTFSIAGLDATVVNAEYSATLFIPKNRIAFPVRFTSLSMRPSNYISVGHV